jgi:hypothetical protein
MTLVPLAQNTADIGEIGSEYRRCWCHWLKIQPTLARLAQSTDDVGAIGSEYSRHW